LTAYAYPVRVSRAREGGWLVQFRDFPEGHSQAEDGEDVIDIAEGLLQACIEGRLLDSMEVTEPSAARPGEVLVSVPLETATKAALLSAVASSGTSRVALAKAVSMDEKEIRRMLDPRHSSKLPRLERVLKALGKDLTISVVDAPKPPEARERKAAYRVRRKPKRKGARATLRD
jgi:antitoxin HicB